MILVYQRILPHYRVPLFRRLNAAVAGGLALFHGAAPGKRPQLPEIDLGFPRIVIRNFWIGGERLVWQPYWRGLQAMPKPTAIIAEHSPRILSLYPLLHTARRHQIPMILWGAGYSQRRSLEVSDWRNRAHRYLIESCDAYIAYTAGRRDSLAELFDPRKLFVATNTLDTDVLFRLRNELESEGVDCVKRRLGLERSHYLCFMGRLHTDKEPMRVLELLAALQTERHDVGALFIGNGPERERLTAAIADQNLQDVHLLGEINDCSISAPFLFISDLLFMPCWVGLVANHAFSFGLPLLSQCEPPGGPAHPPEIEYVRSGETGFIVRYGDLPAMVAAAHRAFEQRETFRRSTIAYTERHLTIERWLEGFNAAIDFAVAKNTGSGRKLT